MREIKFRVWDTCFKNEMVYFGSYFELDDCFHTITFHAQKGTIAGDYDEDGKRFILQQYTGLKDKNGKEIYEGDIINAFDNPTGEYNINKAQVIYSMGGFRDNYNGFILADSYTEIEIIGNIYENPELL